MSSGSDLPGTSEDSCDSYTEMPAPADLPYYFASIKKEETDLRRSAALTDRARYKKMKEELDSKERKEKAARAMNFLLSTAEKYSTYFLTKLQQKQSGTQQRQARESPDGRGADEPAAELAADGASDAADAGAVRLKYFEGGELRGYQTEGLLWLKLLFENGVNGILADEMGLGKTVQVIALICHLLERGVVGPYLIVAPLSTIPNWMSELNRFAPRVRAVLFHGSQEERRAQYAEVARSPQTVVVTSYQVPLREAAFLQRFRWQYLVVDEGHRLKNHRSQLGQTLRSLPSLNRLLLTGTPLQNNLIELWALLNFLMPQFFTDADAFASLLLAEDLQQTDRLIERERASNIISDIHRVLAPFMLRRVKSDVLAGLAPKRETLVYCPLSQLQLALYTHVLRREDDELLGRPTTAEEPPGPRPKRRRTERCLREPSSDDENGGDYELAPEQEQHAPSPLANIDGQLMVRRVKMANPMMMLRKVVNHPYLVHFPLSEGEPRRLRVDEDLVRQSGKLMVLDALLPRLLQAGHKVLLFSTMTSLLDLIEEYLMMRGYGYCRLDGSDKLESRRESVQQFNDAAAHKPVFLMSTRAGGLGLNLTAADTVILFDQDWNPQADTQAQDRCHRIGQTRPVVVYTLVAKGTVDEHVLRTATAKRRLEKVVIQRAGPGAAPHAQPDELRELLRSVDQIRSLQPSGAALSPQELDQLLDRSDLLRQMRPSPQ